MERLCPGSGDGLAEDSPVSERHRGSPGLPATSGVLSGLSAFCEHHGDVQTCLVKGLYPGASGKCRIRQFLQCRASQKF